MAQPIHIKAALKRLLGFFRELARSKESLQTEQQKE